MLWNRPSKDGIRRQRLSDGVVSAMLAVYEADNDGTRWAARVHVPAARYAVAHRRCKN